MSCQHPAPALADLPSFKKDLRPVRSRNKIDPDLFEDGPDGLRCMQPCVLHVGYQSGFRVLVQQLEKPTAIETIPFIVLHLLESSFAGCMTSSLAMGRRFKRATV